MALPQISTSTFDDEITAERNYIVQFTYLYTDPDTGEDGDPIDLTPYTRIIYSLYVKGSPNTEIVTVDSTQTTPVDQTDWLKTSIDPTDGIINLEIPGSAISYVASDSQKWVHEMVLIDSNGGVLEFFKGTVKLVKPIVELS